MKSGDIVVILETIPRRTGILKEPFVWTNMQGNIEGDPMWLVYDDINRDFFQPWYTKDLKAIDSCTKLERAIYGVS